MAAIHRQILRDAVSYQLTLESTDAVTGSFDMRPFSGGFVTVPSAWTAANIGFYVCETSGGTFVPAKDSTGGIIQITDITTTDDYAYQIPTTIFGAFHVKLWSKSATSTDESDVNQGADRTLVVQLKV